MLAFTVKNEIKEALEEYAYLPGMVRSAVRAALSDTAKTMRKEMLGKTAKDAKIPQKAIRQRFRDSLSKQIDAAKVWVGTFPVSLSMLGRAVQTKTGVRVGRQPEFRGAFLGRGKLEGRGIFIRYHSRHYDPARYGKKPGSRSRSADPIVRALGLPISEWVDQSAESVQSVLDKHFGYKLRQELARVAAKAAKREFQDRMRG